MALFTTADRDSLKAALMEAAIAGTAEYTVPGRSKRLYSLKELRELLEVIQADLAADNPNSLGGMRIRKLIPPEAG
jgi:hypothetical protein